MSWLARVLGWFRPPPTPPPPPPGGPPPSPSIAVQLLAAHNAERARAGVPILWADVRLIACAQAHSDWMARTGKLTHTGADGILETRAVGAGYRYSAIGENIAEGDRGVADVMAAWMASPGHRHNVLGGNYREFGGAVTLAKDGTPWWTACFGRTLE